MPIDSYAPFRISGVVDVVPGRGDLPVVQIRNSFAEAEVYLLGATVAGFVPKGEKPLIWLSPTSPFVEGKAIRGGIPVCFPWFGPHRTAKDFPIHGCVRFRSWSLESTAQLSDGRTRVVLFIESDDATRAYWPHDFRLELAVTVGKTLEVEMTATNVGTGPFSYENCLHTYFAVGDAAKTKVQGLDGLGYMDRRAAPYRAVQAGDIAPAAEVNAVYMGPPARLSIQDAANGRRIVLDQGNFKETVVWNLWEANAAKNAEIADGWKTYLCVEAANCVDTDVTLLPGTSHRSWVRYGVEKA